LKHFDEFRPSLVVLRNLFQSQRWDADGRTNTFENLRQFASQHAVLLPTLVIDDFACRVQKTGTIISLMRAEQPFQ
jgi:hypothetical protein